jgi:GNAT superfamily N-acetyltransferase
LIALRRQSLLGGTAGQARATRQCQKDRGRQDMHKPSHEHKLPFITAVVQDAGMKIRIRPYAETDQPQLLQLARELQAHEASFFDRMKPASDIGLWYIDLLKRQCHEHEGVILIAEMESRCVGYATILTKMSEDGEGDEVAYDYAYVGDLAVLRELRGRGIGSKLIAECQRLAKEAGRGEIRLGVIAANERSHRFYLQQGFADLLVDMRKKLA